MPPVCTSLANTPSSSFHELQHGGLGAQTGKDGALTAVWVWAGAVLPRRERALGRWEGTWGRASPPRAHLRS